MLAHLKDITGPSLDPLQFAYRANRSVDDAVNMGLHYVLQHLDRPGTYVRILFVDYSSAFNTIIPNLLLPKLTQLSVPTSVCQWITSFMTDRQQLVRLGKYTSSTCTISTGAPQGCVLSPLLFSLYTNDCTFKRAGKSLWTPHIQHTPLWTVTVWSTLQSSGHQNDQTQTQFLSPSNLSHEHLTIIMVHTIYTLLHLFI